MENEKYGSPILYYKPYLSMNTQLIKKFHKNALFCLLEMFIKKVFPHASQSSKKKIDKFCFLIDFKNLSLSQSKKEVGFIR